MKEVPAINLLEREVILSREAVSILRTLLYFDIFHFPLTLDELYSYQHQRTLSKEKLLHEISHLVDEGLVKTSGNYFFVSEQSSIIPRRKNGEVMAEKSLITSQKFSKIISKFPFVRAVFVSGSLSKGYMDKDSDIDYFIVTQPGRLWVARTLLVLFKKIFLFNSHRYFCVNYFVDENHFEIPDRNIFTATELVSVIPTYNYKIYVEFREQNHWTKNFLTNFHLRTNEHCIKSRSRIKLFLEKILKGRAGEWLDKQFFRMTLRFWKRKFAHFDEESFDLKLRSRKHVSKHHPLGYQQKVLSAFEEKITRFELIHSVDLSLP